MSLTEQLLELPRDERLRCMEALWCSLRTDETDSPAWHKKVLASRVTELEQGDAELISASELRERLGRG